MLYLNKWESIVKFCVNSSTNYLKKATVGPCNAPKPSMVDFVGRAKWNAWNDLKQISQVNKTKFKKFYNIFHI